MPNAPDTSTSTFPSPPVVLPPAQTGKPPREASPARPRATIWDVPFDALDLEEAVERIAALVDRGEPSYVITANLNYIMLHHRRPEVRSVTRDASLVVADGQPIVWRSRLEPTPLPGRVAGSELIFHLVDRGRREGWRVYLLGGAPGVAARCGEVLKAAFPGLVIAGTESPPFRPLTPAEQAEQGARIAAARPHLLLVAFGQPKGELWIYENHPRLSVPVSIQLGASFDFIAGTARRAPAVWQRLGLEWAYRMIKDPRRLVPRYAANAAFLAGCLYRDWRARLRRLYHDGGTTSNT